MSKLKWTGSIAVLLLLAARLSAQTPTPEDTVKHYLAAMKSGDFKAAFADVSKGMAQGKNEADWVSYQQWVMQATEAKIADFHVYPGKTEGDRAQVPNVLKSQDKYLNQAGDVEHELYTLVREDGRWKIDQQQIVDPADVKKWFPAEAAEKTK